MEKRKVNKNFRLGRSYYEMGDTVRAVECWQAGAKEGDAACMYELAENIDFDLWFDVKVALDWYKKSAELGYDKAQYRLGEYYERGECVKKNIGAAKKWYSLAAAQGNKDAKSALERLKSV